jgi:hypothetical protein
MLGLPAPYRTPGNTASHCRYHSDTAIAIRVVLVVVLYSCSPSLPKEKERGNKGRAIYRAVGSQVTYATLCSPAAYALRVTLFITCTRTDSNLSYYILYIYHY